MDILPATPSKTLARRPGEHTILIVDDTPESIEVLRSLLSNQYRLVMALDGEKAVKVAQATENLDLILLDIAMPKMNGFQVMEKLRQDPEHFDIPVIFISALGETLEKVRAFEAGAVDYITKPYDPDEVLARVRTHLQILDLTRALKKEVELRREAEAALKVANEMLEKRVQDRTSELQAANTRLQQEVRERILIAQEKEQLLQQVRNLVSHQQALIEDERTRISRELHDEFGQNLTALKMDLAWLAKQLPPERQSLLIRIATMSALLDDTIQLMRRVARELRPGILDELGLLPALEWLCQEYTARTQIPCRPDLSSEKTTFGRELDTTIFRVCQEALTNTIRHSGAHHVRVSLRTTSREVVFSIEDDGKGIEKKQVNDANSFGLLGMRERVRLWNGEIDIQGHPAQGTRVFVRIPLGKSSTRRK